MLCTRLTSIPIRLDSLRMASRPSRLRVNLRYLRRRCESQKVCFDSRAEALDGAESAMEAGRVKPGCHLMPYLCERCAAWHLKNERIVFRP